MNMNLSRTGDACATPVRSGSSLEFEAMWRGLKKESGLIPNRREFRPERAKSLLRDLVLVEARLGEPPTLPIRLVGSAAQQRIQNNIVGHNYLDFVPPQLHAGVIESVRLIFHHPCGLWQVMTMHYAREYAQNVEITAFPLQADAGSVPLLLVLMQPVEGLVSAIQAQGRAILVDTASVFEFIDVGAGSPAWPV